MGNFFDGLLGTGMALALVGIFAGTAAGITEVVMLINRQQKNAGDGTDHGGD